MKSVRVIAAVVLVICAGLAAYFSYKSAFAPPPMHSAAGGPPPGFSMPKMGRSPSGVSNGPAPKPSAAGVKTGHADKTTTTKGDQAKPD